MELLTIRRVESAHNMEAKMAGYMMCETCANYYYDEEYEEYVCDVDMDEDDYMRFITDKRNTCPYYRDGDEYKVVRHQM